MVEVTNNGIDYTYGGHTLLYEAVLLSRVLPASGPVGRYTRDNQRLWLETDRDARNVGCQFGTEAPSVPATLESADALTCISEQCK